MPTSEIDTARGHIVETIVAAVGLLPGWRVHRYPPTNVASPCIYVDMPSLQLLPDAVSADFPVTLVVDGTAPAQLASFDYAVAALWDALDRLDATVVTSAYPGVKDAGGPNQRSYTLSVTSYLVNRPLCDVPLSDAAAAVTNR